MERRTKANQESREAVAEALRRPRYDVIPLQGAEEQVVEHVPSAYPEQVLGYELQW